MKCRDNDFIKITDISDKEIQIGAYSEGNRVLRRGRQEKNKKTRVINSSLTICTNFFTQAFYYENTKKTAKLRKKTTSFARS